MRWLKGLSPDTALYGLIGANLVGYVLWQTHPHVMEQVALCQILLSFAGRLHNSGAHCTVRPLPDISYSHVLLGKLHRFVIVWRVTPARSAFLATSAQRLRVDAFHACVQP